MAELRISGVWESGLDLYGGGMQGGMEGGLNHRRARDCDH